MIKLKNIILIIFVTFLSQSISAQDQVYNIAGINYIYKKPGTFVFISNIPSSLLSFGNSMFNKEYTLANILIGTTTAFLIASDQSIYNQVSKWGQNWGIGNEDKTKTLFSIGNYPIFRGPTDLGSAMYFIGDGWTHIGLSLSFLTAGLIENDNRALQTASQIAQVILTAGIATQLLKHITGRETPILASQSGGIWRLFPNQIDYHKNVPKYDAFPSGHLAVAFGTLTVIAENYKDYKWIRPVGYSLLALLSFQMVNNGVHWISDYPLALGIGYLFGKIAVSSGRREIKNDSDKVSSRFKIYPIIGVNGSLKLLIGITL